MHRPSPDSATAAVSVQQLPDRPRSLAAGSLFVLATLLLTVVVGAMAVGEGIPASPWTRAAYIVLYLVAALAALMASAAALRSQNGTDAERRRRASAWLALVAYALVVPAAIAAGAAIPNDDRTSIGSVLNELIAFCAYPAAVGAILAFNRPRARHSRSVRTLDLAIVVTAIVTFAGFVYLRRTADGLMTEDTANVLYFVLVPVGALAVLLAATWLVLDRHVRRIDTALALVLGAIATSSIADLSSWVPGLSISGLNAGLWGTAMWILTAGAVVEVLSPVILELDGEEATRNHGYSLIPVLSGALVALALLGDARNHSDDAGRFLIYGLVAVMLLVITRLFSALHENQVLLDRQQKQDARFRSLVRRSSDALLIVRPDDRLIYHSPALSRVFGLDDSNVLGTSVLNLISPDDRHAVDRLLHHVRRTESERAAAVVRSAAIPAHWVELVVTDQADDPDIGGFVIAARDVTRRRLLEGRLAQAEKLEAVGRLAGGVAHDFNNMLTAILGYADLVEQSAARGRVDVQDVQEIQRAARRSAELTRQLLAFARRQMVAPREIDASETVSAMDRMLRRLLGNSVRLELDFDSQPWRVLADPSQIEQIVLNLALNARDAMPDGGVLNIQLNRVEIQAGSPPVGIAGDLESMPAGQYVRLRVQDSGVGIGIEHLDRIFEPFFTTKGDGMGTGLGLATVYGITKQANGFLGVDTVPGQGTTFEIYFPRAIPGQGASVPTPPAPHEALV